ncbi:hypothetical protein [Kaistella carnis]|uniref:Uncharacterized protein n=1 Tax=Kaistella carnis TaxID=1241979 RepID=A0A3G8XGF6_9FLAO|nr:hypothetical protein [Kaistella carnis]AZI31768.1 hypothetical protein EIB73_00635 [Kaistella carnis]
MKTFHPFFIIGTFGIILTAIMHIIFALLFEIISAHSIFFTLYPTFIAFLILGTAIIFKKEKESPTL